MGTVTAAGLADLDLLNALGAVEGVVMLMFECERGRIDVYLE